MILDIEDGDDFADTLKLVRTLAGVTQQELGAELGVSAGRIGKYERGINPPNFATAVKLMRVLGWRIVAMPTDGVDGA